MRTELTDHVSSLRRSEGRAEIKREVILKLPSSAKFASAL
jgi:hypothetical protein